MVGKDNAMAVGQVLYEADCSNCAALCCVAFAFDKSDMFALDKQAGSACPNLGDLGTCNIHKNLDDKGFKGCVNYDCAGAGQHVTQGVFGGKSWQSDPKLLRPMLEAFSTMRQVHDALQLLQTASSLPLLGDEVNSHLKLVAVLKPSEDWTVESLVAMDCSGTFKKVRTFLTSLRHHIKQ